MVGVRVAGVRGAVVRVRRAVSSASVRGGVFCCLCGGVCGVGEGCGVLRVGWVRVGGGCVGEVGGGCGGGVVGDGEAEEFFCLFLGDGVACAGEGGEELGGGGGVSLFLGAEDGGGPLGVYGAGDAAGGGGDEACEGVCVGGACEGAGAGFGHHGEGAAEGEGDEGFFAPFGAGGEGVCGVLAGFYGLEFGAAGDGAAAFADDLADDGVVFLRHLGGGLGGELQEEGGVAEDVKEGVPAGGGVVFGAEEEHGGQVERAGLCDDDAGGVEGLAVDGAGGGGGVVEPGAAACGADEAPRFDDFPALEGGCAADFEGGDASEVAHGEVGDGFLEVGDGGEAGAEVGGLLLCEGGEGGVCGDGVCVCFDARGEVFYAADAGGDVEVVGVRMTGIFLLF